MSCTSSDVSYIYWGSDNTIGPITISYKNGTGWVASPGSWGSCPYTNELVVSLPSQGSPQCTSSANNQIIIKQVSGQSYAGHLRYGDQVFVTMGKNTLFGSNPSSCGWSWWPSPPDSPTSPSQRYASFESDTKSSGDPILYGDQFGWMGDAGAGSWKYVGSPDPYAGCRPYGSNSPTYSYSIQSPGKGTPTQQFYSCVGTTCEPSSSPSGLSCSDCLSSCAAQGTAVPGNSNTYKPFPGVSTLPLAGCGGETATQTYTLYSGLVTNVWLMFLLGETPGSVTSSVPKKVKSPKYPSSNGFLLFSYDGVDGSASIAPAGTNGPQVSWGANSNWQSWSTGGGAKTMTVDLSLNGISLTLNGSTQSVNFMQLGYASGLYCNLYAVQAIADDGPQMVVSGNTSIELDVAKPPKPMAPDWWWYGLLLTGTVAILMVLILTFCCNRK